MLRRLAWSSVPSSSFAATRLSEIIAPSRRYNQRHHISGKLLFTGTYFLGIHEGQGWDLNNLWPRLKKGKRHRNLIRIGEVLCGQRWFPEWGVACTDQSEVDGHIAALRCRQARIDRHHDLPGAQVETRAQLSPPIWAEIIYPIMRAASARTLHLS